MRITFVSSEWADRILSNRLDPDSLFATNLPYHSSQTAANRPLMVRKAFVSDISPTAFGSFDDKIGAIQNCFKIKQDVFNAYPTWQIGLVRGKRRLLKQTRTVD